MSIKVLTKDVRQGLRSIESEMREYASVKRHEGEELEARQIEVALDWISYQVSRCDRHRAFKKLSLRLTKEKTT